MRNQVALTIWIESTSYRLFHALIQWNSSPNLRIKLRTWTSWASLTVKLPLKRLRLTQNFFYQ